EREARRFSAAPVVESERQREQTEDQAGHWDGEILVHLDRRQPALFRRLLRVLDHRRELRQRALAHPLRSRGRDGGAGLALRSQQLLVERATLAELVLPGVVEIDLVRDRLVEVQDR